MKLIFLILAAVALAVAQFKSYEGYRVLRVTISNKEQLEILSTLEEDYDFWTDARIGIGWVDVMANPSQDLEKFLIENHIAFKLHIPNVEKLIQEERRINKQGRAINWENYQRIHAREWVSPASATWMIRELITNPENSDILDDVDFYILPVANVDGYEFSHTNTRLWRKTRSQNGNPSCIGVDPNRNFEFHWGGPGTSPSLCSEIYKGPEPWSEPETKAMRDFILNTNANWQVYIALHSYAQMWLTPWGYTYDLPADYAELKALGVLATQALTAVHGTRYEVGSVTELLTPGAGGSDDWAKGLGPFKYSYTVEVRDTGRYGFVLPPEQIIPTAEETWAAFQVVARFLASKQ